MWNRSYAACMVVFLCAFSTFSFRADAKDWKAELDEGYAAHSSKPLTEFLEAWHAESKPVSAEMLAKKPAFEQDVYAIFQVLYQPDQQLYKDTAYAVVQDKIAVTIVDSDLQRVFDQGIYSDLDWLFDLPSISKMKVEDFRPAVAGTGKKILYYKYKYIYTLARFICQDDEQGYEHLLHEDNTSQQRIDRLEYLSPQLDVIRGHWGSGWHFETHPYVEAVFFSSDKKRAAVSYRVGYEFGEALLFKSAEGKWTVKEQGLTGVE
ncbi:hypothetical protein NG895_19605 [Aeoliella sp. ICT_H6.2]|uniref:Uncharacterized protein n=1 Tax=Aeoliella straminimaris TaxID=2954799 RepID=A0A9X2FBS8_9BACT|nr:hypothetical protein [Aeoliella straminimaris]MCO6046112.1 hypothetical protein [Aeoliella straminimaris]